MDPLSIVVYIVLFAVLAAPCAVYLIAVHFYREANQDHSRVAATRGFFFKRIAVCGMLFLNVLNLFSAVFPEINTIMMGINGLGVIFSLPAVVFLCMGLFIQGPLGRNFRGIGCAFFVLIYMGDILAFFDPGILSLFGAVLWALVMLSNIVKKWKKGLLIASICVAAAYLIAGIVRNITAVNEFEYEISQAVVGCAALALNCAATLLIVQMNQGEFDGDAWKRYYLQKTFGNDDEETETFAERGGEITLAPTGQPVQVYEETEKNPHDIFSGGGKIYRGIGTGDDE